MKRKRIVSGIISVGLVLSMATPAFATDVIIIPSNQTSAVETQPITSFSDVSSTHWAYNDIMMIVGKGAISGTTAPVNGVGTYNPEGKVTLGQFLAISTRLVAPDKIKVGNGSHWATPNYSAAIESNLIRSSDFEGTPLSLDANISREDMAYILVNIAKTNGETLEVKTGIQNNIKDFNSISPDRQEVVLQAYSNGLLAGDNLGKFNPQQTATRAQIAAVFCRVMNYIDRPTVTINPDTKNPSGSMVNTKGQMTYEYASKYILDSMKTAKVYQENGKWYVSCTLQNLPDGFYWQPGADVYHETEGYIFSTEDADWVKSTGTIKIELVGVKSISDTAPVSFSLFIRTKENSGCTVSYKLLSSSPNKIRESTDTKGENWINFDTSSVFVGIK